MVHEIILGAGCRPDHRSDHALEVSDRDRCMEDADRDIEPGMFSFVEDPVCGTGGE